MKMDTASFIQQLRGFIKYLTSLGSIPLSIKWRNGMADLAFPTGHADYISQPPLQLGVCGLSTNCWPMNTSRNGEHHLAASSI